MGDGKLFVGIGDNIAPNFDFFKKAESWVGLLNEAISTALWLGIAGRAGGDAWAWGLAYVVVKIAFGSGKGCCQFNACSNWVSFLCGNCNWVDFIFTFFFQCLGAIGLHRVGGYVGLSSTAFAPSLEFSTVASLDFYKFFFGQEFLGIFLFCVFTKKAGDAQDGLPQALWEILLVAVAFWVGGNGFGFIPARSFFAFTQFANASAWATTVVQFWAATVAAALMEYVW